MWSAALLQDGGRVWVVRTPLWKAGQEYLYLPSCDGGEKVLEGHAPSIAG